VLRRDPQGQRNKYRWDEEAHGIVLDRLLFSSIVYPTDYGFIPETLSRDGYPLDAMVCVGAPTFPGCLIEVRTLALLRIEDDTGADDKLLCVPLRDPAWSEYERVEDLPGQLRAEIEHFFSIYKDLEQATAKVEGWHSREERSRSSRRRGGASASGRGEDPGRGRGRLPVAPAHRCCRALTARRGR
jgi:inorganic pyrophosphatase